MTSERIKTEMNELIGLINKQAKVVEHNALQEVYNMHAYVVLNVLIHKLDILLGLIETH